MRARSSSFPGCSRWGDWQEPLGGRSQPGRQARLALSLFLPGSSPLFLRLSSAGPRMTITSQARRSLPTLLSSANSGRSGNLDARPASVVCRAARKHKGKERDTGLRLGERSAPFSPVQIAKLADVLFSGKLASEVVRHLLHSGFSLQPKVSRLSRRPGI